MSKRSTANKATTKLNAAGSLPEKQKQLHDQRFVGGLIQWSPDYT